MTNLSSKFKKVRKNIKKGNIDISLDLLNNLQKEITLKIENLNKAVEVKNKVCCSIESRFLEIFKVDSASSKLTINANTGRFSLKISNKASEKVCEELTTFVKSIMLENNSLPPITLRGRVSFNKALKMYEWCGKSNNNGKFSVTLRSETLNKEGK